MNLRSFYIPIPGVRIKFFTARLQFSCGLANEWMQARIHPSVKHIMISSSGNKAWIIRERNGPIEIPNEALTDRETFLSWLTVTMRLSE